MNKKVFISMLCLSLSFILAIYVLKIFFPEPFMFAIQNENIIKVGQYIDSHAWLYLIVMFAIGMTSDYLYFSAVCKKWNIDYKLIIIMALYNTALACLYTFAPMFVATYSNFVLACSMCYMILLPIFFTKDIKALSITFCVYYVAQSLSLGIRDLSTLLLNANTITTLLMCFDGYIWSLICCLIFNYKRGGKEKHGNDETTLQ